MATNTTNYNLTKPDVDDFYDVNQFNQNADIIDSQLKNNADSIEAIRINDLTALPPVEATLNSGKNTLTTEHDSTARVTAFEGDTIVNYVPLFDSGLLLSKNATSIIEAPNKFRAISANAFGYCGGFKIPLKPNTTYTLIMEIEAIKGNDYFFIRSNEDNTNLISGSYQGYGSDGVQFKTKADTSYVHFIFSLNANESEIVYSNVRIVEGTATQPFVANIQGIVNPTIDNTTTGDSITLLGTFHKGDIVYMDKGQYSVLRKKKEMILDGNLPWVHSNVGTGYKIASVNLGINSVVGFEKVVKYNGLILPIVGSDWSKGDEVQLWTTSNVSTLYISALNTDTGFGPNYVPTADEWKAYFLGWQMSSTNTATPTPYNGTGTKYWRAISVTPVDGNQYTTTLPTTQAPFNSKWKPYKLAYDLASPIKEPVQAINSVLKLTKGDNTLQVSEGRIVREIAHPIMTDGKTYVLNSTWSGEELSKLKYKVYKILNVYENGEIFGKGLISNTHPSYGNESYRIPKENYNPTAVYTVDYEPLYPFEVTAPTNPITIKYQSNLASVVGQSVADIVELKEDVAVIKRDMVIKGEGVEWLTPTLLNGATTDRTNPLRIGKDSMGNVFIKGVVKVSGSPNGLLCFVLPVGYRPNQQLSFPTFTSGLGDIGQVWINPGGNVPVTATNASWVQFNMVFKAEQ